MATTPPTITAAPTAPQRGDKTTFSTRVDAFITWLVAAVAQFQALAANVYGNAVDAFNSATAAGSSADASASSASAAAVSAAASSVAANAVLWVSGATVTQFTNVISPTNAKTYRRKTSSGSGTTDPLLDTSNYVLLSDDASGVFMLALATVASPVVSINFLSLFTASYDRYTVEVQGLIPGSASGGKYLSMRLAHAGALDTAANYRGPSSTALPGAASSTLNVMFFNDGTAPGRVVTGTIEIRNANSTQPKSIGVRGSVSTPDGAGGAVVGGAEGISSNATVATGFGLYWSDGTTFTAGTVRVYGHKNA